MNISELLEHCLNTQLYQSGEQAQKEENPTSENQETQAEQTEDPKSNEEKPKEDDDYNSLSFLTLNLKKINYFFTRNDRFFFNIKLERLQNNQFDFFAGTKRFKRRKQISFIF